MPSIGAPPSTEPQSRGTILHSLREALLDLWGEDGLRQVVGALCDETREATDGPRLSPLGWYPTSYIVEWSTATFDGPARRDEQAFRAALALSSDYGFGRVRRVFMRFATPVLLAERAADLWRREHTHGSLEAVGDIPRRAARLTLRGHPFTTTFASRLATAEVFRHILSRSRASNVRESHALQGDALVVKLHWE